MEQTRKRYLYGVFCGQMWGMSTNRRDAETLARKAASAYEDNAEIRRMPARGNNMAWDAPTFYDCSDHVQTIGT